MQKRWLVKAPVERDRVDAFREEIKADRITTELLISRGIFNYDDAREFFNPDLANFKFNPAIFSRHEFILSISLFVRCKPDKSMVEINSRSS